MELGLLDGREDDQHNGIDFVKISKIFAMLEAFFFGMTSFYRVYVYLRWRNAGNKPHEC